MYFGIQFVYFSPSCGIPLSSGGVVRSLLFFSSTGGGPPHYPLLRGTSRNPATISFSFFDFQAPIYKYLNISPVLLSPANVSRGSSFAATAAFFNDKCLSEGPSYESSLRWFPLPRIFCGRSVNYRRILLFSRAIGPFFMVIFRPADPPSRTGGGLFLSFPVLM